MMTLKDLTINSATLLCLLTGQRCQTIHSSDINFIQFYDGGCIITIREVLKHTKAGKHENWDLIATIITYVREYMLSALRVSEKNNLNF